MKKITLVHIVSSLERGGAQAVLYTLLSYLDHQQFEHHVIYFRTGPYVSKIKALNIATYHIQGFFYLYDPLFFIRLWCLIKKLKPDKIHSLLWAANCVSRVIAYQLDIPLVCVIHNNVDQDGLIRYAIDYLSLSLSNKYVTVSDGTRISFIKRYPWINKKNIQVIPNGVNRNAIISAESPNKKTLKIPENALIIGSVGRFEPVKNYTLLLKSFSLVVQQRYDVHLILIGSGSQERFLREYTQQLNIADKVTFIIGEQSYKYLSLFDCFVLSSYKEGISIALLEAMALGIVPIVTTTDTIHPVIHHGVNGFLVPTGNEQLLTKRLIEVLSDRMLRRKISACACEHIQRSFDHTIMVKAYTSLLS